jgi:5-methyltetrahydropteroyltriglutamate--homocysteine methyltransferase
MFPTCTGPFSLAKLSYTGHAAIQADIEHFKAALQSTGLDEGFMTSVAPGSCARIGNAHYASDEEFLFACADAIREEYRAIVGAGLILQLDDPGIAENWDMIVPEPALEDDRDFTRLRIEALNHAIRGLPQDRIRFHLC